MILCYMRFTEGGLDHIKKDGLEVEEQVIEETICGIRAPRWFWSFHAAPTGPLKCEVCFAVAKTKGE